MTAGLFLSIATRLIRGASFRQPTNWARCSMPATGVDVGLNDLRWVSHFKMHKRVVERLSDGRRFLLGDAGPSVQSARRGGTQRGAHGRG